MPDTTKRRHPTAMRMVWWLGAWLLGCSGVALAAVPRPVATVQQGRLAGTLHDGVRVFKGIPYAAPPVGPLRWQPPVPPAHWGGTRDAAAYGPSCMQPDLPPTSVYDDPPPSMSEDCLTLNVWAPKAARAAPVIVWIYGGALAVGGTSEPLYDATNFARRGVVFVSMNYRLGVFGWLALPALSAESPHHVSGNYGLLDQIAALQWVRANVAAFGGDPRNVTIMGESAGALSVTYLLTSPLAHGLFQKAILESANTRAVPELRQAAHGEPSAEATGSQFAIAAGALSLGALRAMPAKALLQAAAKDHFWTQGTIDGWVLPQQVVTAFDQGRAAHVPLLAGFNSGEIRSQRALLPHPPANASDYVRRIERGYGELAAAFLRRYPATDIPESMLAMVRDAVYGWATERLVRKESAAGQPAYLYYFDHCYPAAAARDLCEFHASELPFVFGHVGADAVLPRNWPRPEGAPQQALSDAMIGYWASFARTGTPTVPGQPVWQPYSDDQAYMRFADQPRPGHHLLPGMFTLQEQLVERRRRANQQWFLNVGVAAPPISPTSPPKARP